MSAVPLLGDGTRPRSRLGVGLLLALSMAVVEWMDSTAWAQQYAFRHYGAESGVPVAYALAFDGAGSLLVGTNDGLARFDGRGFEPVPLPVEGVVWRLTVAPDGAVWGLTNDGALFRLPLDGTAERIPTPAPLRERLREQTWLIKLRADGRSRLWLSGGEAAEPGQDPALYRWEPERQVWTRRYIPGAGHVKDFLVQGDGDDGALVVAARGRVGEVPLRAGRLGPARWMPLDAEPFIVRPHPTALAWVGASQGVFLLGRDGATRRITAEDDGVGWIHGEPAVDAAGRLLITVRRSGVGVQTERLAPDGTVELSAANAEGLPGALPTQYAFDPEGALWIAHLGGLTTLEEERAMSFPLVNDEGIHSAVTGMAGDPARGVLWVTTYGGIHRLDGSRFAFASGTNPWIAFAPVVGADGEAEWSEQGVADWRARSSRGGLPRRRPLLVHEGPGGRYETDDAGFWRVRDGRRTHLGPGFLPGAVGAEDAAGRLWFSGDSERIEVVWGDTLASACPACLPPSLRAALDTLNQRLRWWRFAADAHGRVWVGGLNGLAVLYPRADGTWAHRVFRREDGLLDPAVSGVSVSPDGERLWLATRRGIQGLRLGPGPPRVDPFAELRVRDGLEGEVANTMLEDTNGMLWAALTLGKIHRIDWRALTARRFSPPVHVERVEVNGRAVAARDGLRLREGDGLAVGLWPQTYRKPQRVRLEYRLAGRDTAWTDLGPARRITLAALPAGVYAVEARAVREGQPPGPSTRLALAVAPPFWRTAWFAALAALALAGLVWGGYRRRTAQVRAHNEALRAEVAQQTRALTRQAEALTEANGRLREVDRRRRDFFANVSHEFRTPLTLILGPLDDLRQRLARPSGDGVDQEATRDTATILDVARHNARRLLRLINQLLDAAKLEDGAMSLHPRPGDLAPFVCDVGEAFAGLAERRGVAFRVEGTDAPLEAAFDADAVEKVLANLLSNAFKFTPSGGVVELRLERAERDGRALAAVAVRDSGPGIPDEAQAHVFERFYRVDEAGGVGTGIGLALAKELAELHGGTVEVESAVGFGSVFTLLLPLEVADAATPVQRAAPESRTEARAAAEMLEPEIGSSRPAPGPAPDLLTLRVQGDGLGFDADLVAVAEEEAHEAAEAEADRPLVLVADDHAEIRAYVGRHLRGRYRVVEAADGREALQKAREHPPDLVLSDVMMPGMDGLALLRALKSDPETDFVPVVLLTARAAVEDRLEGLHAQADDYLTKPFEPAELVARVENLIAGRQRLRARLARAEGSGGAEAASAVATPTPPATLHAAPVAVASADAVFLERVREAVEDHMGEATFGVEALADAVGMSRVHLFRRLRELCDEPPSALLLRMRLERAAALLRARSGSVSEVAYGVGFRSVSHFSKAFRARYGATPSAYAEAADAPPALS